MDNVSDEDLAQRDLRYQRSAKISELMGEYLLKGWRMLGSNCTICDTILFLNPDGNTYCVACSEVDNVNTSKDELASTKNAHPDNNFCGDLPSSSEKSESVDFSVDSFEVIYNETRNKLDRQIEKSLICNRSIDPSILKGPKALLNRCLHCQTNLILTEEGLPFCLFCGDAGKLHLEKSKTMWDSFSTEVKINAIKTRYPLIESIASVTTDLPDQRLNQRPDMISEYIFKRWRITEKCCNTCNVLLFQTPEGEERCIFCTEFNKKEKQASLKTPKTTSTESSIEKERQRQRSDKISQILGQYLLRGWRMLDKSCPTCETILMLNREGKLFCVCCNEVDNQNQEPKPKSMQNGPNNIENITLAPNQQTYDYTKFLRALETNANLKETQSTIVNAIYACSQRIIDTSVSMDAERYANAIKSLSEALLNFQKLSSL
nr:Sjoegren syndrome:scleroderma autoantigen 1 [Hymenolepis microstoma]